MTLQVAPRYDVDGFERLAGLAGPEMLIPIAAGIAGTAAISAFLGDKSWATGDYNMWMGRMNATFPVWDKLGWDSGCWKKYPNKRAEWKGFWTAFGNHYRDHGQVSTYSFLSDAEEGPARVFLQDMARWSTWFGKNCGLDAGTTPFNPNAGDPTQPENAFGGYLKWGAIAIGGLVALNVISGLRGAFSKQH
jgi:hypothetical protein